MTSAEAYAAMVEAQQTQQARIRGQEADRWGGTITSRFRMDPRRPLSPNLEMIATYLGSDDILVDHPPQERERAEQLLNDHFDELYLLNGDRYVLRPLLGSRGLLITWEPRT